MSDGQVTLSLGVARQERLRLEAERRGLSPSDAIRQAVDAWAREAMTRDEAAQVLRTHLQGWVSYHAGRGREGADEAHLMAGLARDYARVAALSGGPSTGSEAVPVRVGPVREEVSSDVTCWTQLALLGPDRDGLHDLARAAVMSDEPSEVLVQEVALDADDVRQLAAWLREDHRG